MCFAPSRRLNGIIAGAHTQVWFKVRPQENGRKNAPRKTRTTAYHITPNPSFGVCVSQPRHCAQYTGTHECTQFCTRSTTRAMTTTTIIYDWFLCARISSDIVESHQRTMRGHFITVLRVWRSRDFEPESITFLGNRETAMCVMMMCVRFMLRKH